jgi:hypothetical protein
VRLLASFIAGVFLVSMCWWVWEGLDKNRNEKAAAADQALQQQAITAWKGTLEQTLSSVGTLQGAAPPQVAATLTPALDALAKGDDPGVTAKDMTTLAGQLNDAAKALEKFSVSDTIRDRGFDRAESDVITSAHDEIASGLQSLAVAASVAAVAIDHPDEAAALAAQASQAASTGQSLIQRGWTKYGNIAAAAGIPLPAPQPLAPSAGS